MSATATDAGNWLIADVGATSCRAARLLPDTQRPTDVQVRRNDDFDSLESLLRDYLDRCESRPRSLALAIAAPVHGDEIRMINRDWTFSGRSLGDALGMGEVRIINDFHAIAWALPALSDDQRVEIGTATEHRGGNMAVLGPGSGLGMSAWIADGEAGLTMTGEGGHITLPARDAGEEAILAKFRERYGHASAERVLSGPGLMALHEAMHGAAPENPEAVTADTGDAECAATLAQFFLFLGSAAAELALITGAFGGLHIAGGIVPDCVDRLHESGFRARFEDKNRYRDYMQRIPTYVISDPYPGLTGLAEMIRRR